MRIQFKAYFMHGGFNNFISILRFILSEVKMKSKAPSYYMEFSDEIHVNLLKELRSKKILAEARNSLKK